MATMIAPGCGGRADDSALKNADAQCVNTVAGRMCYVAHNGLAVAGGDIVLGTLDEVAVHANERGKESFWAYGTGRWSGGVVPYVIDSGFSAAGLKTINDAIADYAKHTAAVRWVPRTWETDYVEFVPTDEDHCLSAIGRVGGAQQLTARRDGNCSAAHEMGHALGLYHEHQRPDRDSYITVHLENVRSDWTGAFDKLTGSDGDYSSPYDTASIMHYDSMAFSSNGKATILTKDGSTIPYHWTLSSGDVASINNQYKSLDGSLVQFGGSPWQEWNLSYADGVAGVTVAGTPAVVAGAAGTANLFVRGTDGSLLQFIGAPWNSWNISSGVGGTRIAGNPVIASGGADASIFARGTDGSLLQFTGSASGQWAVWNISANAGNVAITGDPIIASGGANASIFARGSDGSLLQFTGSASGQWTVWNISNSVGGTLIAATPVLAATNAATSVFAQGTDGSLLQFVAVSGQWSVWNLTQATGGTRINGTPAIANAGSLSLFARGADDALLQFTVDGSGHWSAWNISNAAAGTRIGGNPALTWDGSRQHVFARTSSGDLLEFVGAPWSVSNISYATHGHIAADPAFFGGSLFAASAP